MRTLVIDNDDSYTFNLLHLLGEVNGEEPIVVRNEVSARGRLRQDADAIDCKRAAFSGGVDERAPRPTPSQGPWTPVASPCRRDPPDA